MPQLKGQPGSSGMNPPGGVSTINLSNWSDPRPPSASRRSMQSNDDSFPQPGNESTGSRPSAGLSESNNNRSIARMHQQAPGGDGTMSFGAQSTAAEIEALLKKRHGYDEKRKEMYGSGIFNEASGSCDGDSGYGGFADKAPAAGENQMYCRKSLTKRRIGGLCGYQEPRCRPTSDAKAKELNGNNIFGYSNHEYHPPSRGSYQESEDSRFPPRQSNNNNNNSPRGASPRSYGGEDQSEYIPARNFDGAKLGELSGSNENLNDLTGRLSFSNAKARELAGDNIFGPSPLDAAKLAAHNREPAGRRSQLMLNNMHDENPDPYGQKKHEMKSAELSGNNIFHGGSNETPQHHQRSVQKVREMSGSDIFSDDQPKARNTVGGIRKPPGGGSTIMLA